MKRIIVLAFIVCSSLPVFSQLNYFDGTIDEAFEYAQKHKINLFIDIYTDWCHYCKVLDKTTFKDQRVVEVLNSGYVVLKVNAQKGEGKQFAVKQRVSGYPTMLILKYDGTTYQRIPGYVKADDLIGVISKYKTTQSTKEKKFLANKQSVHQTILLDSVMYLNYLTKSLTKKEFELLQKSIKKGRGNDYEWFELTEPDTLKEIGFILGQKQWAKLKSPSNYAKIIKYDGLSQYVFYLMLVNKEIDEYDLVQVNTAYNNKRGLVSLHSKLCVEYVLGEDISLSLKQYKKLSKKEKTPLTETVKLME